MPGDGAVQEAYENATPPNSSLITVSPADLPQALANGDFGPPAQLIYLDWAPRRLRASGVALVAGFLLCLMGLLWRRSASPGRALGRFFRR